jgi:outer membrane protein assembly factor BamB
LDTLSAGFDGQDEFHVKRRAWVLVLVSLFLLISASGCITAASPRGWAQPIEMSDLILVSTSRGKLDAIDQAGNRRWRFPDDWAIFEEDARSLSGIYSQPIIDGDTVYVAAYNGFVYAFRPSEASPAGTNDRPAGLFDLGDPIVGGIYLDAARDVLYVTTAEGRLHAPNATDLQNRTSEDQNVRQLFTPFDTGDRIWTPPVLSDGSVFFGSTDGRLFAVDAQMGTEVWPAFQSDAALVSTPVIDGNLVLIGGFDRRLHAVDASTGQEAWSFEATDWIWSKPLVDSGVVYVADFAGKVFAISLADQTPLWEAPFDAGASVRSGPTLSGGNLIVGNEEGNLFGIDASTGRQLWGPVQVGSTLHADLLPDESTVYVAPTGCTTEDSGNELYYYRVNVVTRERQSTGSVC